jgi:hypothetical protein
MKFFIIKKNLFDIQKNTQKIFFPKNPKSKFESKKLTQFFLENMLQSILDQEMLFKFML